MSSDNSDIGKLETDVEIKASAEQFHNMFRHKPHHVAHASSEKIQGCELHEGEWGKVGSVVYWNYFHEGKAKVAKEIVEAIDEEKNLITFKVIEGDLMEHYKSIKFTIQATPKSEGQLGSVIHWTIEYEKHHDEILDPHSMLEFATELTKDLENHLLEDTS
ncbi:Major latex protein domain containing protein [Parasponia andersonii]|uniref:Major latex protein domain containing protein n=1 Tax=Parasponia andersonii TaxID=3476 RepID=A0A2P5BIM1_PARAD|nr:Major latex protein domain containing protein [Parasponia andersonii]